MTIVELAEKIREAFEYREKPNGERGTWHVRQDAESPWKGMAEALVRHVHGESWPNNYLYEYTVDALDLVIENQDRDPEEIADEIEADVYTSDLLRWLVEAARSIEFVDEARENFGPGESITDDIAMGQVEQKRHIFREVVSWLQAEVENLEEVEEA